jgi:DNA primase
MYNIDTIALNEACNQISDKILSDIGLRQKRDGSIRCRCPIHGGNNPTAFFYNPEIHRWFCFTNQCHVKFGGDFIGLVRGIMNLSFEDAIAYLYETYFPDGELPEVDQLDIYVQRAGSIERVQIDDLGHKSVSHHVTYFVERKISQSTLDKFEAFYGNDVKTLWNRACLPVYDVDGLLVAYTGRDITGNHEIKWLHYPQYSQCKSVIYGLHHTKGFIVDGHLFLVEGPIDLLRMYDSNIKNVGALLGTSVSTEQCRQMIKAGVRQVTLLLDPDEAGKRAADIASAKLSLYFKVNNLTEVLSDDPGELCDEELQKICRIRN